MAMTFDKLFESANLGDTEKSLIKEAWEAQLEEAKAAISAELREEYAQKHNHDKQVMIESMTQFVEDKIRAELTDFAKDRQAVIAERVKYKTQVSEHLTHINDFISKQLTEEISGLRADRKKMMESAAQLEEFLLVKLTEEIQDFRKDKQALTEQKVKLVKEGKKQLEEAKRSFVKKASITVEKSVNEALRKEIKQYREDILIAKQNAFGREVFEAFVGTFMKSHLNEGSEMKKLMKDLASKEAQLNEAREAIAEKQRLVESTQTELKKANHLSARKAKLDEMLAPLGHEKRRLMEELLSDVPTEKLSESFDKYLPAVLNETVRRPNTQILSEKSGNKTSKAISDKQTTVEVDELNDIIRLAGVNHNRK